MRSIIYDAEETGWNSYAVYPPETLEWNKEAAEFMIGESVSYEELPEVIKEKMQQFKMSSKHFYLW